jgi:hypothetical protein
METIELNTYTAGESRFDMCGQSLPTFLHKVENTIPNGLAIRLKNYASKRLREYGFPVYSRCVVDKTDDGFYSVNFVNESKGNIGIVGIVIGRGGWPTLDYGVDIGYNQF